MRDHTFIALAEDDPAVIRITFALYGRRPDTLDQYSWCAVDDDLLWKYRSLFLGVLFYATDYGHPTDRLNRYGKTILPVLTVWEIARRLQAEPIFQEGPRQELLAFMTTAAANKQMIVHLGI